MSTNNETARREIERAIHRINGKLTRERKFMEESADAVSESKRVISELAKELNDLGTTLDSLGGPLEAKAPPTK